jgi:hypothetical protein
MRGAGPRVPFRVDDAVLDAQHLEVHRHGRQRACVIDLTFARSLVPLDLKSSLMIPRPGHAHFVLHEAIVRRAEGVHWMSMSEPTPS